MPITVNGQTISDQQIKDFYAQGGNDNQWLQQNGVTDLSQIHNLANQARSIAGIGSTPQDYFKQYQQYNPNGAYANDYNGWINDQSPTTLTAMQSGTYTGASYANKDHEPGGIYGPGSSYYGQKGYGGGLGPRGMGDVGGGWDTQGAASGSGSLGFGGGSYGGSGGGYGGSSSSYTSTTTPVVNPYLDDMAKSITNQMNDNWSRNLAPSIRSGAMAAGGFGGSRQGVVEANGLRDLNQTLGNSLANLYGTGWQNAQQNALQSRSIDNNYDLGLRSNNLGYANLDSNNAQFGANLALNTLNAQNNWAQNGVNAANQMYQMPLYYQNMFNNMQNNISGQGGSTSQTNQGNPGLGFLGGWQLANGWGK